MDWIMLIPLLPVLAFVLTIFLPRGLRNKALYLAPLAMITSASLAVAALIKVYPGHEMGEALYHLTYRLGVIGGTPLELVLSVDSLSIMMLAMVSIIGACVQVFSLAYMKDDERKGWYFTVMSLFTAAMLFLVMSGDLLFTFAMWEIMGVCSYLLIGFWFKEESARKASQKAFLVTRAADLGFFVALSVIWVTCGTFNIELILRSCISWASPAVTIVALGLLWAAMGKSAQFPLSVWLPDAMAGPTPGSALIHAATMVAAGVFVLARMMPIFEAVPWVMSLIGWIGIFTALLGASMACFQTDLKKVLAYSTISQLGLMFVALGAGSAVGALFHLTTHAFFKSLLFLAAGSIIHATHTQDMRKMGGLARQMPITTIVFSVGAFSLAGLIPLSGFFSKDEVFSVVLHSGNYVGFGLALVMGTLTALYVTKTWLTVFFGKPHNTHVHEGGPLELISTGLLAIITAGGGFLTPKFAEYLGHHGVWPTVAMAGTSTIITLVGGVIGYCLYSGIINVERLMLRHPFIHGMFENRLYFDYAYEVLIINPYMRLADALWSFDSKIVDGVVNGVSSAYVVLTKGTWRFDADVIDGMVNAFASLSQRLGNRFRQIQTGQIQNYQRLIVGAVVLLLLVVVVLKGA